MAYWLLKSEPDCWSWDQQKQAGKKAPTMCTECHKGK